MRNLADAIRKYGDSPFLVGLVHGGPGAAGEMNLLAKELSSEYGVVEFQKKQEVQKPRGRKRG